MIARWSKPLLGLALLVGMIIVINPKDLGQQLERAQWGWFASGLVAAFMANMVCAYRWQQMARAMSLKGAPTIPLRRWFTLYLQGISINSVVPGGIIGGDVWRAAQFKPPIASGQAVFFERLSGLWGLFCLSALASLWPTSSYSGNNEVLWAREATVTSGANSAIGPPDLMAGWGWLIWFAAMGPLVLRAMLDFKPVSVWRSGLVKTRHKESVNESGAHEADQDKNEGDHRQTRKQTKRNARILLLLQAAKHPLVLRSLPISIVSQGLTVLAFWFCLTAAGASLGLAEVAVLASAIFLFALVPASLGGFGARETGAIVFLAWVGVSSEAAFLGSLLFGLTATVQGLVGLGFWLRPQKK